MIEGGGIFGNEWSKSVNVPTEFLAEGVSVSELGVGLSLDANARGLSDGLLLLWFGFGVGSREVKAQTKFRRGLVGVLVLGLLGLIHQLIPLFDGLSVLQTLHRYGNFTQKVISRTPLVVAPHLDHDMAGRLTGIAVMAHQQTIKQSVWVSAHGNPESRPKS